MNHIQKHFWKYLGGIVSGIIVAVGSAVFIDVGTTIYGDHDAVLVQRQWDTDYGGKIDAIYNGVQLHWHMDSTTDLSMADDTPQ